MLLQGYRWAALYISFNTNSLSSANFVGTACPGVGRGRRLPGTYVHIRLPKPPAYRLVIL